MEIGAYFQCYKQPLATLRALDSFRNSYPNGTIILVSDNGANFSNMANEFKCSYFHESTGTDKNWWIKDKHLIFHHFDRMRKYVELIKEDYFLILEDDVFVVKRILEPLLGDLNGNSYNLLEVNFLNLFRGFEKETKPIPYTGHGGSIWNKKKFLELFGNRELLEYVVNVWETMSEKASEDNFMSVVCLVGGGKLHHLSSHKDLYYDRVNTIEDISILHQMKDLYRNDPVDTTIIY